MEGNLVNNGGDPSQNQVKNTLIFSSTIYFIMRIWKFNAALTYSNITPSSLR